MRATRRKVFDKLWNEVGDVLRQPTKEASKCPLPSAILTVDATKNYASLSDVKHYWSIAVCPSFRERRGAVLVDRTKEDITLMRVMISWQLLHEFGVV